MGFFKRGEVVDLTEWKRRGLLEMPEEEKPIAPIDKNGMIDFTALGVAEVANSQESNFSASAPNVPSESVPSFDFLDNPSPAQTSQANLSSQSPLEMNELKLKLDDTMFKLDMLLDKIGKIENRLGLG